MADLLPKERLLPSLLDRLTDEDPSQVVELRENRLESIQRLKVCVQRDLEWLLNSVNLDSAVDFENYPELESTTINYGLPSVAGTVVEGQVLADIEKSIKQSIVAFEPRILKNTLRVKFMPNIDKENRTAVTFQIEGMLWGLPMPEALFLQTKFDLELGSVQVTRVSA